MFVTLAVLIDIITPENQPYVVSLLEMWMRSPDNEACWPGEVFSDNFDTMGWVAFKRGAPYLAAFP